MENLVLSVCRYEGRCGLPTNFDATYCYALGYGAGALLHDGKTGLISSVCSLFFSHRNSSSMTCTGVFTALNRVPHLLFPTAKHNIDNELNCFLFAPGWKFVCSSRTLDCQWDCSDFSNGCREETWYAKH